MSDTDKSTGDKSSTSQKGDTPIATRGIELPNPTPDQAQYLLPLVAVSTEPNLNVVIGGPRHG